MKTYTGLLFAIVLLSGCSGANVDDVKAHADQTWASLGYKVVGYEGYQYGTHVAPGYGGAHVWYTLRRIPDNGFTYTGSLQKWGDEYHNTAMRSLENGSRQP